jgi:endonuclease IV
MNLKLGGHLRTTEGLRHVVINARAMGYNLVQISLAGDRDYVPPDISERDAEEFRKMMYGIETYVHLPFIINPCEADARRRNFYARTFRTFSKVAADLGAKAVIVHPGFRKEQEEPEALKNMAKFFEKAHHDDLNLDVLIETDSGSKNGSAIGSLPFIGDALQALAHPSFAMCVDTEHLYARGINLWNHDVLQHLLDDHQREIRLVHLNSPDPDVELGSFRDRHNTPFQDRPDWDHAHLIRTLAERYPLVLERRSLSVQEQDAAFVRSLLTQVQTEEAA